MFSFKFGQNANLHGIFYVGYSLEGLLYDAWSGVPVSRSLILGYFSRDLARGEIPPRQILEFVGAIAEKASDPSIDPTMLLFPHGRKESSFHLSPATVDAVMFFKAAGVPLTPSRKDGEGAFLRAAKMEYGAKKGEAKATTTRNEYYSGLARERRIKAVGQILKNWYQPHSVDDSMCWHASLREHYKNIKSLD